MNKYFERATFEAWLRVAALLAYTLIDRFVHRVEQ